MPTALTLQENDPSRFDDKFDRIVKWYNDERAEDDPRRIKLAPALFEQLNKWNWLYRMLSVPKNQYKRDTEIVRLLQKEYPELSERRCYLLLRDMRRFYGVLEAPNLAFEKVMLIASIKDTLRRAKVKNDLKAAAAAEKNLSLVLGAEKSDDPADQKTIINIINYNPAQLGAQELSEDVLQELIDKMLTADKKKAETPFDDYEDVTR